MSEWTQRLLWATVAGLVFVGALLGATAIPLLMERIGTRRSFVVCSAVFCLSFVLAALSKWILSAIVFIVARFLSGIGIGAATTLQTVYLAEISPVKYRGLMGTLTGFATTVGVTVACGVGLPQLVGNNVLWHWAYLIEMVPSAFLLVFALSLMYESPVYSIKNGDLDEARRCLEHYQCPDETQLRIDEIITELKPKSSVQVGGVRRLVDLVIYGSPSRSALVICMLLNATVSFSGILAVSFFGTLLLQAIGFSESGAALANFFASFSGIFGNIIGSFTIDRIGRRKLVIGGLVILTLLNICLMIFVFLFELSSHSSFYGYPFLLIFIIFLFAFSFGVGPMAWFLATELTSSVDRSLIQSLSVSCQYATCFISPMIFYPAYAKVGGFSFIIFILPLCFTTIYLFMFLPETNGESIENIVQKLSTISNASNKSHLVKRKAGIIYPKEDTPSKCRI